MSATFVASPHHYLKVRNLPKTCPVFDVAQSAQWGLTAIFKQETCTELFHARSGRQDVPVHGRYLHYVTCCLNQRGGGGAEAGRASAHCPVP